MTIHASESFTVKMTLGELEKELASLIGVTPMAVTYYENGERRPDMVTIKAMAKST